MLSILKLSVSMSRYLLSILKIQGSADIQYRNFVTECFQTNSLSAHPYHQIFCIANTPCTIDHFPCSFCKLYAVTYPWRAVSLPERLDLICPMGSIRGVLACMRVLMVGQHFMKAFIGLNSDGSKPPKFLLMLCSKWLRFSSPLAFAKFTTIFMRLKIHVIRPICLLFQLLLGYSNAVLVGVYHHIHIKNRQIKY